MPNPKRKSKPQENSSLKVETLIVGQMAANCYLLYDSKTKEAMIIDPGDDAEYIQNKVADLGLTPKAIIATHGHFDHIMALEELRLIYKIPFFLSQKDETLLKRATKSYEYFLKQKRELPINKPDGYLKEKDKISLGGSEIIILETPGHTPGSISILCPKERLLFTGDTLFADGFIGRTDFKYSSEEKLKKSLERIKSLGENIICYAGHGESFSI